MRNLILFITFVVILITLVLQGLTLPLIIRWLNFDLREEDATARASVIHSQMAEVGLRLLREKYSSETVNNSWVKNLATQLENNLQLQVGVQLPEPLNDQAKEDRNAYLTIHTDMLERQRSELHQLRNLPESDHELITNLESQLDLEEEKLRRQRY